MLNKQPIFIVGLTRGGTSVLLNILRSHPGVCSPRGETQEVFSGKPSDSYAVRYKKKIRYALLVIMQRELLFSPTNFRERKPLSSLGMRYVDKILYAEKTLATGETQNLYKSEGVRYSNEEISHSRLLCKNIDGLAFATELFHQMYPDATFFGLVRNGFAACEGHLRRGVHPRAFGKRYALICGKILSDAKRRPNFYLLRYEDLTQNTNRSVRSVFDLAGLDVTEVPKYRLVVGDDGRRTGGGAANLQWYSPETFEKMISNEFDEAQIARLPTRARIEFLSEAAETMEQLGYL